MAMFFQSRGPKFTFSFTWIIENFILCPKKHGEALYSPKFTVENLGMTDWQMNLYPRGSNHPEYLACYLQRLNDSSGLEEITVTFKLTIWSSEFRDSFEKTSNNISFIKHRYCGFSKFMKRSLLDTFLKASFQHKLIVRCDLSPSDTDAKISLVHEKLSLQMLSLDLTNLYVTGDYHDMILKCGHREFKVHRAIISARAPKLADELTLDFIRLGILWKDIVHISSSVLDYFLFYLYSGRLILPMNDTPSELFAIAKKYDLKNLMKQLQSYPTEYTSRTCMDIEHKTISWRVLRNSRNEFQSLMRIIPLQRVYVNDLILICSFVNEAFGVERLNVTLSFSKFDVNQPLTLDCRISAVDEKDSLIDYFSGYVFFETDKNWQIPLFIQQINPKGKNIFYTEGFVTLCFDLTICYGEQTSHIESTWINSERSHPYVTDFCPLSLDLSKLRVDLYSDVSIISKNITFPAHRAILSARSCVFRKMFMHNMMEKRTGIVRIDDISPQTIRNLLMYIYSGKIDSSNTDILSLYEAADKYQVITLKEFCSTLLIDCLTIENACNLLVIGYLYCDDRLDTHAQNYIRSYAYEVRQTSDWEVLKKIYPSLAKKIFRIRL